MDESLILAFVAAAADASFPAGEAAVLLVLFSFTAAVDTDAFFFVVVLSAAFALGFALAFASTSFAAVLAVAAFLAGVVSVVLVRGMLDFPEVLLFPEAATPGAFFFAGFFSAEARVAAGLRVFALLASAVFFFAAMVFRPAGSKSRV
ncbi:MAG: hypothetical protein R3E84_17325 [Pseudomonadales bacterium]|nr:hypothetical protein [Pseudomonadales bacterium]